MMEKQLIPAGYKKTEVGVIPSDWVIEPLCDVLDKNRHIRYGVVQPGKYTPDGCLMLRSQDYSKGWSDADGMHRLNKILEKQFQNAKLKSGDLVITIVGAGVAQIVEVPDWIDGTILSRSTARIAVNEEVASSKFILYVMSSSLGRTQVLFNIKEGAQPVVSSSDVGSCLIPLPGKQEQTVIANALSDVDALIAALEKLINKKSAIKTAAMQQLLTGKKRLPPFDQLNTGYKQTELGEIPGDWEVAAVHQLLKESPKYGINAAAVPLTANLPVYIRITDISEDGYFQPSERVGVNNQFSDFYKLKKGDIVLARTGASVGKSYLYREADGELIYAGFLIKLSPKESILDSMFLFQYLRSDPYWAWVNVMSMRSGQPGINGNEFGSLQIPLPSIEEQIAIANVFSDMDKDLEALQQRLHKTQQIKQGMMQELLTGKTRLVK